MDKPATDENRGDLRAQIILTLPESACLAGQEHLSDRLKASLSGGGVSAVIMPRYGLSETEYDALAQTIVPLVQVHGVAVLLCGHEASRIAGRLNADGLMLEAKGENWAEDALDLIERWSGTRMVGLYGALTRDSALTAGDLQPDAVHFGPLGGDIKPEPHRRNLELARWWAEMIEIPCIIPLGSDLSGLEAASATGAEFVALSRAVFDADDPSRAMQAARDWIVAHAPVLLHEGEAAQ